MMDLITNRRQRLRAILFALILGILAFAAAMSAGAYASNADHLLQRPGAMILFAFVGCWLLILLAKLILTPLLQREENYYEEGSDDDHV